MGEPLFLILRRLRRPLLAVIGTIAISILGLANIPGVDANGNPATLGYFHALYIMSYTATTIGFGEVPYPFSEAQRLWVIFSIYISVIAWAYALGVIFHMTRDPAFRAALARSHFSTQVRRQTDPFILVIGYGQSGSALARMLDRIGYNSVIVELHSERVARIETQEYQRMPLFVSGDGRWPEMLVDAGVTHPQCQTMVVLAGDDDTAQAVAIGGSALNPNLRIITRARSEMAATNLESFNRIEIVNPYETFALNLGQDFSAPEKLQVREWLTGLPGAKRPDVLKLPVGHWVICGFGRFGHYIARALTRAGATWTAIDNNPAFGPEPSLLQKSYSQETLSEAGIERAVGIVACTDRDAINLAAVRRARALNADLFVAVRQMHASNAGLVEATQADLRFIQADITSHEVRQLITSPLLNRFLLLLRTDAGDLAQRVSAQLEATVQDRVPFLWVFSCMAAYPGLREAFAYDPENPLRLGDLFVHPHDPSRLLQATALMLVRNDEEILLPESCLRLQSGDRILFAGPKGTEALQKLHYLTPSPLPLIRTGVEPPRSWVFRKLEAWLAARR
ncbi:MAG: potassium channel family protein [Burkholderiales bacterium]|jgi:Trk K+ transport system NAD-binding subunit|nr:potassium channel family protein [Burkholderiales bacterium]